MAWKKQLTRQSLLAVVLGLWLPVLAAAQIAPPLPPEKTVEVLGQHIRYVEAGQGPALIFVHGLGSSAASWSFDIGPASQKFHVYALDQIGFGHSDKPLIEYRIETFVEFLQGFMQALNIPKATLVGNSLGGWIAVEFTAQHPEMVDKLVLVDAAGLRPDGSRSPSVDLNPSSLVGMRSVLEAVFYNQQIISDGLVRQVFEEHLKNGDGYTTERVLANIFRGDQYEDEKLASIHAPTLA
ncbi:MAG: alpha/beta fold hydrolase [Terriglobia bacterium]